MREFIDKDKFWIDLQVQTPLSIAIRRNAITEQEIVKPYFEKIRAEIKKEIIPRNSDQYDHEAMWQNCGLRMALKAIDKYKAESEIQDADSD